jgi:hypothetical protein
VFRTVSGFVFEFKLHRKNDLLQLRGEEKIAPHLALLHTARQQRRHSSEDRVQQYSYDTLTKDIYI